MHYSGGTKPKAPSAGTSFANKDSGLKSNFSSVNNQPSKHGFSTGDKRGSTNQRHRVPGPQRSFNESEGRFNTSQQVNSLTDQQKNSITYSKNDLKLKPIPSYAQPDAIGNMKHNSFLQQRLSKNSTGRIGQGPLQYLTEDQMTEPTSVSTEVVYS